MVRVCVRHSDFYKLLRSNLTNVNILCPVRFRPEQISAVTDPGPEHLRSDRMNTKLHSAVMSIGVYHYHVYTHSYADGSNGINESDFHLLLKVNVGGLVKSLAHSLTVSLSVTCQSSRGQHAAVM